MRGPTYRERSDPGSGGSARRRHVPRGNGASALPTSSDQAPPAPVTVVPTGIAVPARASQMTVRVTPGGRFDDPRAVKRGPRTSPVPVMVVVKPSAGSVTLVRTAAVAGAATTTAAISAPSSVTAVSAPWRIHAAVTVAPAERQSGSR